MLRTTLIFACLLSLSSCCTILRTNRELDLQPKHVVLSFDDGPNSSFSTTPRLLEVLKKHGVKAYFCLMGVNAAANPDIVRAIVREGHTLVIHGYGEQQILTKPNRQIARDIDRWRTDVQNILGPEAVAVGLYRPPFGLYRPSVNGVLRGLGLRLLPVSFYALDAEVDTSGKQEVIERVIEGVKKRNGALIVIHDGKDSQERLLRAIKQNGNSKYNRSWVPQAVDSIITSLQQDGYTFGLLQSAHSE
jgi:peptidoglycan-N-acetylglucosamine deacetylase